MISPKLKLPLAACRDIEQNYEDTKITATRISLLVWAFLRLAVSILWTVVLILVTIRLYLSHNSGQPLSRYYFEPFVIFIQLIEIGMLVTFIVAGFKKSASLYLVYYWYCIVTLIIFVIAVTLYLYLGYDKGHYFGEFYIFYYIYDITAIVGNDELGFLISSILDVGLEILLIYLIKTLINNYRQYVNKYVASENV